MVTYNRIAAGCGYVWVMCLAVSVVWVSTEYGYDFWAGVCDVTWANFGPDFPREFYFAIVCAFIYVFIPSAIILACNLLIIQFSKEKGHAATAGSDGKQDAKSKANSKVLKAMIIVILSFFTLTFPSALIKILKVIGGKDGPVKYIPNIFTTFTTFLQLSASIVNPFIYGLFRKDFRDAYAKLWKQMKQALNLK
ncbi:rhodopsin isoform X1 [Folsomia candida]|nr:rhodopsin isoform X1 [Folsomia candida]